MFRIRIFTGLLVIVLTTIALAPVAVSTHGACGVEWATGSLDAYRRGQIQAKGQLFSSNCSKDCEQHVTDALPSYERAVIKAAGRALTEVSIAHPESLARAEMQAQGQILLETSLLACGAGDWVSA